LLKQSHEEKICGLDRAEDAEVHSDLFDETLNSKKTIFETLTAVLAILDNLKDSGDGRGDRSTFRGKDALLAAQVGFDAIRELLLTNDGEGSSAATPVSIKIFAGLDSMAEVMASALGGGGPMLTAKAITKRTWTQVGLTCSSSLPHQRRTPGAQASTT
jgi:hypothetical protein